MVDIVHRVGMRAQTDAVYTALTSIEGLAGWWTRDTSGVSAEVDGIVAFRFGSRGGFDMKVIELTPGKRVRWEVVDGPPEWIGTHVVWDLAQDGDWAIVLFKHEGWAEPVEFMHHCSTKWAIFLMSLKSLIETGTGQPSPDDVEIDNFD